MQTLCVREVMSNFCLPTSIGVSYRGNILRFLTETTTYPSRQQNKQLVAYNKLTLFFFFFLSLCFSVLRLLHSPLGTLWRWAKFNENKIKSPAWIIMGVDSWGHIGRSVMLLTWSNNSFCAAALRWNNAHIYVCTVRIRNVRLCEPNSCEIYYFHWFCPVLWASRGQTPHPLLLLLHSCRWADCHSAFNAA